MTQDIALRFLDNFSLLTVGDNKVPNFSWSVNQKEKLSVDEFIKRFNYKGGIKRKDGTELTPTSGIGIITGFDYLEVIDIDLKVFSTPKEMKVFWDEFIETLREFIYDFDNKFSIYKTKSGGYHILYKSKRVQGNTKIAVLEGHKQAVIESRGVGGYVFVYPANKVSNKSYFEIDFITDEDRRSLWNVATSYNHVEKPKEKIEKKTEKYYNEGLTPWQDFNQQFSCEDVVVPDEFSVVKRNDKQLWIKRHGAESAHSGYIYNNGCMYLFTTGTIYPNEQLISPYAAYTFQKHNGNFTESAKDLYNQGFGERLKKVIEENKPIIKDLPEINDFEFPLDVFPDEFQHYIRECQTKLQMNPDYMGSSLLWLVSVIIGNCFEIEVKAGWREKAIVWLALVGKAGVGKTPSIDKIIFPLTKINNKEVKKYLEDKKKFDEFNKLTKKEQKETYGESYKVEEPQKSQFIVNDITIEALVQMHQQSDNAVGVFKDELAGWLKDMNKYRAGSDLEFWLSTWSAKSVSLNRKTSESSFVNKPFIPVLGGIQPTIFNTLSTEENKENGFLDRLLLSYPDAEVEHYVDEEIEYKLIAWYKDMIVKFYQNVKYTINKVDGEIEPTVVKFSNEAKNEWKRIFNEITDNQNNDNENQYLKSMYPKQKSYIPRFCLIINVLNSFMTGFKNVQVVEKDIVLKAEKLSKYFVNCAKKVKIDSIETIEMKQTMNDKKTTYEKVKALYKSDPEFNRTKAGELLSVSKTTIYKCLKKIEEEAK
jgi:hypothetical protein